MRMTRRLASSGSLLSCLVLLCLFPLSRCASADGLLKVGEGGCSASTADGSTSFNLARLQSTKGYTANDRKWVNGALASKYTYVFNVCRNITAPDPVKCAYASGPAWQLTPARTSDPNYRMTDCRRLGDGLRTEWTLLDETDPSRGVSVNYLGGEPRTHGEPRQFRLNFVCADTEKGVDPADGGNSNEIDAAVDEGTDPETKGLYEIEFVSRYACPTQCLSSSAGLLCNGGFCGYDSFIQASRCFCQNGLFGPDCSQTTAPPAKCDGLCLFLAFTIALLVILLVAGAAVYWKVHRIIASQRTMGLSQKRGGGPTSSKSQRDDSSSGGPSRLGPDGTTNEDDATSDEPNVHTHHTAGGQHMQEVDLDLDEEEDDEDLRAM